MASASLNHENPSSPLYTERSLAASHSEFYSWVLHTAMQVHAHCLSRALISPKPYLPSQTFINYLCSHTTPICSSPCKVQTQSLFSCLLLDHLVSLIQPMGADELVSEVYIIPRALLVVCLMLVSCAAHSSALVMEVT